MQTHLQNGVFYRATRAGVWRKTCAHVMGIYATLHLNIRITRALLFINNNHKWIFNIYIEPCSPVCERHPLKLRGGCWRVGGGEPEEITQNAATKEPKCIMLLVSQHTLTHTHTLTKHKANTTETLFTEYLYVYYVGRDVAHVLVSTKRLMAAKRQRIVYIRWWKWRHQVELGFRSDAFQRRTSWFWHTFRALLLDTR